MEEDTSSQVQSLVSQLDEERRVRDFLQKDVISKAEEITRLTRLLSDLEGEKRIVRHAQPFGGQGVNKAHSSEVLSETRGDLQNHVEALSTKLEEERSARKQLQSELSSMYENMEALSQRCIALEDRNAVLESESSFYQDEMYRANRREAKSADKMNAERKKLLLEIERQKSEIELLKYENEPVVIEDEKKNQEIEVLKRDLEAKILEIALLKQHQETARISAAVVTQGTENANLRPSSRPEYVPGVRKHACCALPLRNEVDAELVRKLEEANAKLLSRSKKNASQKRCIDQLKVRCQEYLMQERKMSKLQEESVGLEKQIEQLTEAHQELLRTFGKAKEDLIAAQQQVASLTSHIQDQQAFIMAVSVLYSDKFDQIASDLKSTVESRRPTSRLKFWKQERRRGKIPAKKLQGVIDQVILHDDLDHLVGTAGILLQFPSPRK